MLRASLCGLGVCLAIVAAAVLGANTVTGTNPAVAAEASKAERLLRHVVLMKFKDETTEAELKKITDAFAALPKKIDSVVGFEWGTDNSPEGLSKGFTHCFLVTFADEKGREIYLPHPDHKAFVELAGPHIADVTVVDYWTK